MKNTIFKILFILCLCPLISQAATFTVDSTNTNPATAEDTSLGDGNCATAGANCTILAAFQEADALAGNDIINLGSSETYTFTSDCTQAGCGSFNAVPVYDATDDLTINCNDSILESAGGDAFRFFDLNSNGGTVTFNDCIFDSFGDDDIASLSEGGTFYVQDGILVLDSVTVSQSDSYGGGGAIGVLADGELSILDSIFSSNTSCDSTFGDDNNGGAIINRGSLTVVGSSFISNECLAASGDDNAGGAIAHLGVDLSISDSSFISNTTQHDSFSQALGGAVFVLSSTNPVSIETSTFSQNKALRGGALYIVADTTNLSNNTFSENQATDLGGTSLDQERGGAIYQEGGTLNIYNTILCDNISDAVSPDGYQDAGTLGGNAFNILCNTANFTNLSNLGESDAGLEILTHDPNVAGASYYGLEADSPAIDAATSNCISDDQLDEDWIGGAGRCEIGSIASDVVADSNGCEVTTAEVTDPGGETTLAEAITEANNDNCTEITFASSLSTVTVSSTLTITKNSLTISGGSDITVQSSSFSSSNRLFNVQADDVTIQNITLKGEDDGSDGIAIRVTGDDFSLRGSTIIDFDIGVLVKNADGANLTNNTFGLESGLLAAPNDYAVVFENVTDTTLSGGQVSASSVSGILVNGCLSCTIQNATIGGNVNESLSFLDGAVQNLGIEARCYTSSPDENSQIAACNQNTTLTLSNNNFCYNQNNIDINGAGSFTLSAQMDNNSFCSPLSGGQVFQIRNGANDDLSSPAEMDCDLATCTPGSDCNLDCNGTATAGSTVQVSCAQILNDSEEGQGLSEVLGTTLTDVSGEWSDTFSIEESSTNLSALDCFSNLCADDSCSGLQSGASSTLRIAINDNEASQGSPELVDYGDGGCSLSKTDRKDSLVFIFIFSLLIMGSFRLRHNFQA